MRRVCVRWCNALRMHLPEQGNRSRCNSSKRVRTTHTGVETTDVSASAASTPASWKGVPLHTFLEQSTHIEKVSPRTALETVFAAKHSRIRNAFATLQGPHRMDGSLVFVDVRSPGEYAKGHIPGATNNSLLDNEQRAVVGTMYNHVGSSEATKYALELVSGHLSTLRERWAWMEDDPRQKVIYCKRGGLRSSSVVSFLQSEGVKDVVQLEGGWQGFRGEVKSVLQQPPPPLLVLHGATGAGKTRLLQLLPQSIDLEGAAQHRGSIFGGVGLSPVSQIDFDSALMVQLLALSPGRARTHPWVFIESESSKVGDVHVPRSWHTALQRHADVPQPRVHHVYVETSMEVRIRRCLEDYAMVLEQPEGLAALDVYLSSPFLRRYLGNAVVEKLRDAMRRRDFHHVVRFLMINVYDKRYKSLQGLDKNVKRVQADDLVSAAAELQQWRDSLPEPEAEPTNT